MKEITLEVSSRESGGKGVARKLRASNKIPAVVYGKGRDPHSLELDYDHFHETYHSLHGENALVNLNIDGKLSKDKAMIRKMQHDPVHGEILHIDFQFIRMDEEIRMSVPVKLIGTAIGVKNYSGVLQWTYRDLDILSLPQNVPEHVEVNIENLNIGDSVHIKDLDYPDIEFLDDENEPVVSVIAPKVTKLPTTAEGEEGVEEEEPPAEEEEAEPEVITEKKAEERKAGKEKKENQ
jgi:large subunit ribosomal protein L25